MKKINQAVFQPYFIHVIHALMIALGCIGLMKNYHQALYFPGATIFSVILLIFLGIGFYYYYISHQKMPKKICLTIFVGLLLMMLLLCQNEFHIFISNLFDVIRYDYFLNFDELVPQWMPIRSIFYQLVILWLGLPVIYLVVSSICSKRLTLLKTIIMIIMFIFPMLIKHQLGSWESYCFIIFIGYVFLSAVILKDQQQQYPLKIAMIVFLCIMSITASLYLQSQPLFQQNSTTVLAQLLDSFFHGTGNSPGIVTQTGMSRDIDGSLPSGDIRLNNRLALTVQADVPFSSYLRAYSLANYSDSQWHEVDEEFENNQSLTTYSDFLRLNQSTSLQSVRVIPEQQYDFEFIPYYFTGYEDQTVSYSLIYDSYIETKNEDLIVIYDHEDNQHSSPEESSYMLPGGYDEAYEQYVYENYMDIPDELNDQLTDLLIEHRIYYIRLGIDETISRIQQLLANLAQYDLNAGTLPADRDFVEYFLFDNRKGSCTHFATAGALLLRKKGIPTRFVRGYIMKASDFHEGKASIPQYRSHAWIEVYKDDMGWVPYEMTPSGNMETVSDTLDQAMNQSQQNPASRDPSPANSQQETTQETTAAPLENQETATSYHLARLLLIAAGIIAVLIIYRYLTTHWLNIKTRHMTNKQKVLTYYQVIWKLSPQHHIEKGSLKDLAYKAKYSLHEITDEEWEKFYDSYQYWLYQYHESLSWYQKLIFKYIKGYQWKKFKQ